MSPVTTAPHLERQVPLTPGQIMPLPITHPIIFYAADMKSLGAFYKT